MKTQLKTRSNDKTLLLYLPNKNIKINEIAINNVKVGNLAVSDEKDKLSLEFCIKSSHANAEVGET